MLWPPLVTRSDVGEKTTGREAKSRGLLLSERRRRERVRNLPLNFAVVSSGGLSLTAQPTNAFQNWVHKRVGRTHMVRILSAMCFESMRVTRG